MPGTANGGHGIHRAPYLLLRIWLPARPTKAIGDLSLHPASVPQENLKMWKQQRDGDSKIKTNKQKQMVQIKEAQMTVMG